MIFLREFISSRVSLVAQTVKITPAMQETQVQSLGGEDPLEEEVAAHWSVLAWRTPWTEQPGGPQSTGSHSVTTERLTLSASSHSFVPGYLARAYTVELVC